MTDVYFTVSMDPADTTIDDANIPDGLKQAYINAFISMNNNGNVDDAMVCFQEYYASEITAEDVSNVASSTFTILKDQMNHTNNVIQLDMDGNLVLSNSQPTFASTKEQSKDILGSVEKLNDNEMLIADSINKRAIIVDSLTQQIKWEYNSDRYIVDAHAIISDNIVISIDNDYVERDITVNKGQTIIFKNDLDTEITIYSGDITGVNILVNFDKDLYGGIFESIVLEKGDRWSYTATQDGEIDWFSYPNGFVGKIIVSSYKTSSLNQYILLESDGLESPYTGRVIKVDCWGNILWSYGEKGDLVKPRDARPILDNKVIIST